MGYLALLPSFELYCPSPRLRDSLISAICSFEGSSIIVELHEIERVPCVKHQVKLVVLTALLDHFILPSHLPLCDGVLEVKTSRASLGCVE